MKNVEYYVYILKNSETDNPFYVGKGNGSRMYYHENIVKAGKKLNNRHLYYKIIKILESGYKIKYEILYKTTDEELAYKVEEKKIEELGIDNLCNLTYGGNGCRSTDEIRKKQSIAMTNRHKNDVNIVNGLKNYMKNITGKTYDEIHGSNKAKLIKDKQSLKKKGKTYEEMYGVDVAKKVKLQHSKSMTGRILSDETKKKISIANTGNLPTTGFTNRTHSKETKELLRKRFMNSNNHNFRKYIIESPQSDIYEFNGQYEIVNFFDKYNDDNNLAGNRRVSPHNLIRKKKNKGWRVIDSYRPYYIDK